MTSVRAEPAVSVDAPLAEARARAGGSGTGRPGTGPGRGSGTGGPRTGLGGSGTGRGEAALAFAILLPALVIAWPGPGAFLREDLAPHISTAGLAALSTLPAAFLALARRGAPKVRWLEAYLVPLLIGIAWLSSGRASDTLEAARGVMLAVTGLVLTLCAATLSDGGRVILTRGIVCIALLVLGPALLDAEQGFAGELGNTGVASQGALPGALIGAWIAIDALHARESTVWRIIGALAWLGFVVHCALAPVVWSAIAFAVAAGVGVVCDRRLTRGGRMGVTAIALLTPVCVGVAITARAHARHPVDTARMDTVKSATGAARVDPGDSGGFFVRKSIFARSLVLLRDHPWTGVGPGQFAVAFPPYRDPAEIDFSSLGRTLGAETEVEHAHDDWLEPVLEYGVFGGVAWILFLCAAGACALASMRAGSSDAAMRGSAALSLLVGAAANATLTHYALSSCLAFALFGTLLAGPALPRVPVSRRLVLLAAVALLLLCAPRAYKFVAHGRALASFSERVASDPAAATEALERAIDACPDSVTAHSLRVRTAEASRGNAELIAGEWRTILSLRPNRFEAWMQLGFHAATRGDEDEARASFERALALDPRHPGLLKNLVTLELSAGRTSEALAYLARLEALGVPVDAWLVESAARLALTAHDEEANALFRRFDAKLADQTAEEDFAKSKALRAELESDGVHNDGPGQATTDSHARARELLADALESRAHRRWARDHASASHWSDAVRSYRQAVRRVPRDAGAEGAPRMTLELAAALLFAGRESDAKAEVQGLVPRASDWRALPDWARDRLQATGWFAQ